MLTERSFGLIKLKLGQAVYAVQSGRTRALQPWTLRPCGYSGRLRAPPLELGGAEVDRRPGLLGRAMSFQRDSPDAQPLMRFQSRASRSP